jgi:hypothetical protein
MIEINLDIDKTTVGLSNVDNTSDANKPISDATQGALDLKADSVIVSTGIISGGVLTINSGDNTKFDISAGKGFIADQSTTPITVTEVEWSAKTAVTLTNLTTSFATDIAIDIDGNVIQQNSYTPEELRSLIFLGGIDHSGGTIINNVFSVQIPANGIGSSLFELTKAIGDINLSGNVFSPNGANLKVNKSSGSTFSYGRNNTVNSENPHTALQSGQTALSFNYVFNNGSGSGSFLASTTDVDTTKYDDGSGTLATVGNNDWSIQRILMFSNTGNVFIQYGTQTFNNKSAATAGLVTTTFPSLSGIRTALVRGYLIVKKGATALNSSDAVFVDADRFGSIGSGGTDAALSSKIDISEKGEPNGVATLDGGGKVPANQLPSSVMQYQGQWDADTNTPNLTNGTGDAGDVYEVTVAGTHNFGAGAITFKVGDWAVYNGTIWQKSDNSNEVVSVNGFTGAVTLNSTNISESGDSRYYTAARETSAKDRSNHTGTQLASTISDFNTAVAAQVTDKVSNSSDSYATAKCEQIVTLTQAEYDAIGTKNINTLYVIV